MTALHVITSSIAWLTLPTNFITGQQRTRGTYWQVIHGFKCRARDTFISLPGLTLAIDEQDYFELVMQTAERGVVNS